LAEIARLMEAVFGDDLPVELLQPDFLIWKFFAPRPDWDGSRSYVVRDGDRIVAHACVWPTAFEGSFGEVRASHLIDWLADPSVPGAGITVYQHLMRLCGTVLAIGGSPQARKLLPRIGFKQYGTLVTYARVIRPWKQFTLRPHGAAWREAARLGRNAIWSLAGLPEPDGEWSWELAGRADESAAALRTVCVGKHSAAQLNYLLDCPAAACRYYRLSKNGIRRGYFLLNPVAGQCRVAAVQIDSEDPRDWRSAYRASARAAAELPATCEVTVASALPWLAEILEQDGFRNRGEKPIMLYDPGRRLTDAAPLHVQPIESDAFFLYSKSYPFVT
jgi:hypothetical protein